MVPFKSLYFEAGFIRSESCMVRFLSSSGRISVLFDKISLKVSTHAHFELHFQPMLSKYEILEIDIMTKSLTNSIPIHN